MTKNRCRIARENAGLSVGQAVNLSTDDDIALHVDRDTLVSIEQSDALFAASAIEQRIAHRYGVNVEWLRGDVDRHDYARVDAMKGADRLTSHDRDTIAEFAASMARTDAGTAAERIARVRAKHDSKAGG